MYSTAIICAFFISANNICLHRTTKMNKLLHKLSCIIRFITKSSSQLNLLLFLVFLTPPTYWLFMLLSLPVCSFFSRHLFIAAIAVEFVSDCLMFQSNCHHCIWFVISSCNVIWSFYYCCFIVAFRLSVCMSSIYCCYGSGICFGSFCVSIKLSPLYTIFFIEL